MSWRAASARDPIRFFVCQSVTTFISEGVRCTRTSSVFFSQTIGLSTGFTDAARAFVTAIPRQKLLVICKP